MQNQKEFPDDLKGWNWGAFFFNWIWGIRFRTYRALWVLVPFVNLVMPFILGFKGNEWAWNHNQWSSVEEFKKSQRRWSVASLTLIVSGVVLAIGFTISVNDSFEESGSTKLVLSTLEQTSKFQENIGAPYSIDLKRGTLSGSEISGYAEMQYEVEGIHGDGVFDARAELIDGVWHLTCLEITYLSSEQVEVLVSCENAT